MALGVNLLPRTLSRTNDSLINTLHLDLILSLMDVLISTHENAEQEEKVVKKRKLEKKFAEKQKKSFNGNN